MEKNKALEAHLSIFAACAIWGLMAPLGKDAMTHGLDGITMVSFRVMGGAILFWLTTFVMMFVKRRRGESLPHVPLRDRLTFAGAAVFGLVCNQCCFTIGLSITSPVNASIVTTSMPIFAMILSFFILREPITWKKAGGVAVGCAGALTLVLTSVNAADAKVGDVRGDVLVMCAQLSYALFLSLFNRFIKNVAQTDWQAVPLKSWLEAGYVVVFGTYVGYLLIVTAQKVLRPTVVSIYNYVQPAVAVAVTVLTGMGVFKPTQGLAVLLVFVGVWLVTKSKSRRDMEKNSLADS